MNMRGKLLVEQTISKYSVKLVNGNPSPVEVTDGLRVLGAPIGSATFAQDLRLIELKSGPQNLAPFFGTHFLGVRIIDADLRSHVNYVLIVSSTVDQRTFYRPLIS
jgi:hypothetical protein